MGKVKAKKVSTPGSRPVGLPVKGRGRPKTITPKKAGSSRIGNYRSRYEDDSLQLAISAVKNKEMMLSQAAKHFAVPKTTLYDRLSGKSKPQLGRPTELTAEEEDIIVDRLLLMGDWGFPLTNRDLQVLIKEYLDIEGRTARNLSLFLHFIPIYLSKEIIKFQKNVNNKLFNI